MSELINKVKGKIKQAAGALAGDKELERKGKVEGALDDVKHAVKDAVKKK